MTRFLGKLLVTTILLTGASCSWPGGLIFFLMGSGGGGGGILVPPPGGGGGAKDTTATVTITSAPVINTGNSASYTVSGACSDDGDPVVVNVGGIAPGTQPTCASGSYTVTFDVSAVVDNVAVTVTADHTDALGNVATQALAIVVKDTIIPTTTIDPAGPINRLGCSAYTVSGTCSENGEVVIVDVGTVNPTPQPTCTGGTFTATFDVCSIGDGNINITVDLNDAAGNSASPALTIVTKDTVDPTVTITTADDPINTGNVAAYTVAGACSDNGQEVTVSVGGQTPGTQPTCTAGAYTVTFDVSGASDGSTIPVTADHDDAVGNSATQAALTVVKDTGVVSVAITSAPTINAANVAAYTVSGTCSEDGQEVTVSVGGQTPGTQPTCTLSAWSVTFDVSAVGDNPSVTITADHEDISANPAPQDTASVVKDTVVPTVAITSAPTITATNAAAYTVSGTCTANGDVVTVNVGGATPGTQPTCTGGAFSVTFDVSGVADNASVSVTADSTDTAGNSATQSAVTVVKDATIPTVTITTAADPINLANEAAYTVAGACSENGRTVTVSVGGVTPGTQPTCTAGAYTVTYDVSAAGDNASLSITADHDDAVGNNAVQAAVAVVKDSTAPTVTITTAADPINLANEATYTVAGACSENGREVTVSVGGQTPGTQPTCTAGAYTVTFDVSGATDGSVNVTADHTDAAGNNAVQASVSVTMDTIAPTVTITTAADPINAANVAAYTVAGACSENGRTVTVSVGGVAPGTQPTCTAGAYTVTYDVSAAGDNAALSITADHDDAAANNAVQASVSVVKDATIPTVTITTAADPINTGNQAAYTVAGACSENGRTVTVSVGGVTPGTHPTCTAGAYTVTYDVSAAGDNAALSITADHDDAAGNNAVQASVSVVKDATIPTVTITTAADPINAANVAAYTVAGACSENGRTVTVSVGGVAPGTQPTCTAGAYTVTYDVSAAGDNAALSITADHDDAAANNAVQASVSVVKDATIPTVTITTAADPINAANVAAYTVAGACSENGRTVTVSVGGVAPGTQPTCTAGAYTVTYDVSAAGDNASLSITADHDDAAGNNAVQASVSVVKDATIPTVTITTAADPINAANVAAYTVAGACSENGRTVTVSVGGVTPGTQPTCTAGAYTVTYDVSAAGDNASLSITADHDDAAGNNAVQASVSVVKDATIPTVTITTAADPINLGNVAAYTVAGACSENGRTVTVSVGGVAPGTQPTCTAGAYTVTFDVTAASDGSVNVTANHTDAAGNNATEALVTVTKSTGAVSVAITSAPTINNANVAAYTVSGTCSENGQEVTVDVGGVAPGTQPTCTLGAWSVTFDVSAVGDSGSVTITADHEDTFANPAPQASTSVVKDTVIPTVTITTAADPINTGNQAAYTVAGACSENGREVTVDVGGQTPGTQPTCTAGAYTVTFDVSAASDGSVNVTADHTDAAGNNATQALVAVTKATGAVSVAITSAPTINNANVAAYTVSGTCSENGQEVTVDVGGVAPGTQPTCTLGAWSVTFDVSAVGDSGSVTITADHEDTFANPAPQASTSVLKDTVNPTVAITSAPAINNGNDNAYTVSGTCSDNGQEVTVDVGGVTPGTQPTCTLGAWSVTFDVSAVADNASVSVTADHNDAAGNSAPQASTTVVKDTVLNILSASTLDTDNDGYIDHYVIVFSEPVDDSTFPGFNGDNALGTVTTDWLVAGYSNVRIDTSDALDAGTDDDTIYLAFDQGGSWDTGAKPDITTTATPGLVAITTNTLAQVATGDITEADTAKPVVVSANGAVGSNSLTVTFSEPVYGNLPVLPVPGPVDCEIDISDMDYADGNGAAGATADSSVPENCGGDDVVTVTVNNDFISGDTADTLAASATIYDAAANTGNPTAKALNITAAPTITACAQYDTDTDGKIDEVKLTFSKDLDCATISDGVAGWFTVGGTAATKVNTECGGTGTPLNGDANVDGDSIITIFTDDTTVAGTDLKVVDFTQGGNSWLSDDGAELQTQAGITCVDAAAPAIISAVASDNTISDPTVDSDDTLVITFSEAIDAPPALTSANIATYLVLSAGSWGNIDTVAPVWSAGNTVLTITFDGDASNTLAVGATITVQGNLQDSVPNASTDVGTISGTFFTDTVGPYLLSVSNVQPFTFNVRFSEDVLMDASANGALNTANWTVAEDPADGTCVDVSVSGAAQITSDTVQITVTGGIGLCGINYRVTVATNVVDTNSNAMGTPNFQTFLGNEQLRLVSAEAPTGVGDQTIILTFNKAVYGSGNTPSTSVGGRLSASCNDVSTCGVRYELPAALGDVDSATIGGAGEENIVTITHTSTQGGIAYTAIVANGVDADGFGVAQGETAGSIGNSGDTEDVQVSPGDRAGFTGAGPLHTQFNDGTYYDDPFIDGTTFSFTFNYGGKVYIGTNDKNNAVFRFDPNGSNFSTAYFGFSAGGCVVSAGPPIVYPSGFGWNAAGTCAADELGPNSETGLVGFNSATATVNGTDYEILMAGTIKTNADFGYFTQDLDATLDWTEFARGAVTGGANTQSIQTLYAVDNHLYMGFSSAHGVQSPIMTHHVITDVGADDILEVATGTDMGINGTLGKGGTNPACAGCVNGVDSILKYNGRLYITNSAGIFYSGTLPGDFVAFTNGADGTPAFADTTLVMPYVADGGLLKVSPGRRGIPRLLEFNSKLYMVRNVGATALNDYTDNLRGELWVCDPTTTAPVDACDSGDWTQLIFGTESELGTANAIAMLEPMGTDRLFVGFDDPTAGIRVFRVASASPAATDGATMASAGWAQQGTNSLNTGGAYTRIESSTAISDGTYDYIYTTAGDHAASVPIKLFRQVE